MTTGTSGQATDSSAATSPATTSVIPVPTVSDPNEPVIDATTTRSVFPNRPLLATGLVLLAGSYGASVIVGGTADREDDKKLVYPVAGPWMDLANRVDCNTTAGGCDNEDLYKGLLIANGIVQGLGALGVVTSLFVPEKVTRRWYLIGQGSTHIGPTNVGRSGFGLGAYGTF
jgi:hypothetical protein